jgi:glutamate-5-semialdehyde dehydrogenase
MTADGDLADALKAVEEAARAAQGTVGDLAGVPGERLDAALRAIADALGRQAGPVLAANEADMAAAREAGIGGALLDRLRLDEARLEAIAGQLRALADVPYEPAERVIRELPGGLTLTERRRPVGVIGANFEARPNVVVDIASQFVKSRNAGVLRTGSAAIRSAVALADEVIAPALGAAGLDPAMIQLVRVPGQSSARALVSQPGLIPLVILRGSGDSTRSLAAEAARHGVRTMAHADGGAVLYVDAAADLDLAEQLIEASLDRLGVCNRLNLLLVHPAGWDEVLPRVRAVADRLGIAVSLPPHAHPLGHEWALDSGREATVTVAPADGPRAAAALANEETSGLAAAIVTQDRAAAGEFLHRYAGTGAFWNSSTRLLDGFKLFSVPETGINIDAVPGPRGPVTFRDLYLRQFVVTPALTSLPGRHRRGVPGGSSPRGRHCLVGDRLERHLVAAGDLDVVAGAARAGGQHVGGLGGLAAGPAGDGGRHRDQVDGGVGRLRARGDETERLGQGFGVDSVPDAEPDLDPGYLAAVGALTHRRQHAFSQAVLVHSAPVVTKPRGGRDAARGARPPRC